MTVNEWSIRKRCKYITEIAPRQYKSLFDEGKFLNINKFFGRSMQQSDIMFSLPTSPLYV